MGAGRPAGSSTYVLWQGRGMAGLLPAAAHLSFDSDCSVYFVYFLQLLEAFIQRTPQALHRLLTPAGKRMWEQEGGSSSSSG